MSKVMGRSGNRITVIEYVYCDSLFLYGMRLYKSKYYLKKPKFRLLCHSKLSKKRVLKVSLNNDDCIILYFLVMRITLRCAFGF